MPEEIYNRETAETKYNDRLIAEMNMYYGTVTNEFRNIIPEYYYSVFNNKLKMNYYINKLN